MGLPKFKMGFTFSGKYRESYIKPICRELLKMGYVKDEIFYDRWHDDLINGVCGDDKLRRIYNQQCELVIVLLSPDYKEKNWTGNIEWPSVKELINRGEQDKICLLGVDSVDIDNIEGLYKNQSIIKYIDDFPAEETAEFIKRVYEGRGEANSIQKHGIYKKPGYISRNMGGVEMKAEWKRYFDGLLNKLSRYIENSDENRPFLDGTSAFWKCQRDNLQIYSHALSRDTVTAYEIVLEIFEADAREGRWQCVLNLSWKEGAGSVSIWEYIPGTWDEKIFSWD